MIKTGITRRQFSTGLAGSAAITGICPPFARAQQGYPNRPVRFILPFGAAGVADITSRLAAEKLGDKLGQRFVVENQPGPGGMNDLTNTVFTQVDERRVKVTGSRFIPDARYRVKLEGAEKLGYRSVVLVGIRDPFMIAALDRLFADVRERAEARFGMAAKGVQLNFSIYGRNAVMGALEPVTDAKPHEVGVLIDAVAPEQELATGVAMFVRGTLQHASYPGIRNTAGNMAYPFSPFGIPVGPAYRYNVYHLMPVANPLECFPVRFEEIR